MAQHKVSRRSLVQDGIAASLAVGIMRSGDSVLALEAKRSASSPQQVLASLMAGNARFASGRPLGQYRDLARVAATAPEQTPVAAVLGCADSRVPIELLFDQGIGDLFVTRVAGNIATPELIASLEYGVAILGVKVLLVLGHSECGAVSAAAKSTPAPGQISVLYLYLQPAVRAAGGDVTRAVAKNVKIQADLLASASPVLADHVKQRLLLIAAGVYNLKNGVVDLFEDATSH